MKNFKSHFKFTKQERSGIFFLLLLIVVFQVGHYFYTSSAGINDESLRLDSDTQAEIENLKQNVLNDSIKTFPFNPNFISDYKGYTLGMSNEEIDRLHAHRTQNKFVNTSEEFQQVTQVSDSLLARIAPYFKFPAFVKRSREMSSIKKNERNSKHYDLNKATANDLKMINGIGDKLSERIVKFRDRLGGFLVAEQLYDVYGLEPQVVEKAMTKFKIVEAPKIEKINVTWASYNELRNLLYINDKLAKSIIEYRNNNTIKSLAELKNLEGFPAGKFDRIKLYLSL